MKLYIEDNKEGKIKVEFEPTISNDLEPGSKEHGVPVADPYKVIYLCLRAATTVCLRFMKAKQQMREEIAGGKETDAGLIIPKGVNVAGSPGKEQPISSEENQDLGKDRTKVEEGTEN